MNFSPQTKERLALQQLKYLNSLPAKKSRIMNCWESIERNGWAEVNLKNLKMEVHRLSGSAGSYGLAPLGRAAQNLDRMLALESEMSSLTNSISDLIDKLLYAFDRVIEEDNLSHSLPH